MQDRIIICLLPVVLLLGCTRPDSTTVGATITEATINGNFENITVGKLLYLVAGYKSEGAGGI